MRSLREGRLVGRLEIEARAIALEVVLDKATASVVELKAPSGLTVEYIEIDGVPTSLALRDGHAARPWYGVAVDSDQGRALFVTPTRHRAELLFDRVNILVEELRAL